MVHSLTPAFLSYCFNPRGSFHKLDPSCSVRRFPLLLSYLINFICWVFFLKGLKVKTIKCIKMLADQSPGRLLFWQSKEQWAFHKQDNNDGRPWSWMWYLSVSAAGSRQRKYCSSQGQILCKTYGQYLSVALWDVSELTCSIFPDLGGLSLSFLWLSDFGCFAPFEWPDCSGQISISSVPSIAQCLTGKAVAQW